MFVFSYIQLLIGGHVASTGAHACTCVEARGHPQVLFLNHHRLRGLSLAELLLTRLAGQGLPGTCLPLLPQS